jgi:hypothetical protein
MLREEIVKKLMFLAALVAALFSLVLAQDTKNLPPVAVSQRVVAPAIPGHPPLIAPDRNMKPSKYPPFCPMDACLYYAGDFGSTDSDADGLYNADYTAADLEGQVWVGVLPAKAASITGSTFNQFLSSGFSGTNPTPFYAATGLSTGNAGTLICNTTGNATMTVYGEGDFGLTQYSYTIKKLKKSCKVPDGNSVTTYVNLLPTSANGDGYLANTDGQDHVGWPEDPNACFFNGTAFGADFVPCSSEGPFTLFSIALTGKQ